MNEFISVLSLDLPKFMNSSDKEKAFILLDVLGIKDKLMELDNREEVLYDERTVIGRDALSLQKHAEELPFYHDAPEKELSASAVIEKQQKAVDSNNANAAKRRELENLTVTVEKYHEQMKNFDSESEELERQKNEWENNLRDLTARIEEYNEHRKGNELGRKFSEFIQEVEVFSEEHAGFYNLDDFISELDHASSVTFRRAVKENEDEIAKLEKEQHSIRHEKLEEITRRQEKRVGLRKDAVEKIKETEAIRDKLADEVSALAPDVDLSVFKEDIDKLESENAKVRANAAHDKAAKEAKVKQNEYDEYTVKVEEVRRERMALLDGVKMPLPGLTVKDSLLYYKGQRWDGMSGAEQLIVGTSIVRAVKPECGFVLMDKLEAMDLKTLEKFDEWLKQENLQVIATRVSNGEECSIIIEDGMVAK